MKKFLITITTILVTQTASAQWFTGTIKSIHSGPQYNGWMFIETSHPSDGKDSCQTNENFEYAFDAKSDEGKLYASILLTAYTAQKTVNLKSTGSSCTRYGVADLENLTIK